MRLWIAACLSLLLLSSCDYKEVEHEIGYKGKARINPWLALEQYSSANGSTVLSKISWTPPEDEDSLWVVPAPILGNESFTRRMSRWVHEGGHLLVLIEHAESETNDWFGRTMPLEIKPALKNLLHQAKLELDGNTPASADSVTFEGRKFSVRANSGVSVTTGNAPPSVFASRRMGMGRISVITDARILRNRWIADHQHADLFQALLDASSQGGRVGVMRSDGLSLWSLIRDYLTEFLIGVAVWLVFWLWKGFSRFGPVKESPDIPLMRGFGNHLEALGDFQWRMDRGESLLAPLRTRVTELGQHSRTRQGREDDDFFQYLASLSGLSRDRVFRALAEPKPADKQILVRTTADLQLLLKLLNTQSQP